MMRVAALGLVGVLLVGKAAAAEPQLVGDQLPRAHVEDLLASPEGRVEVAGASGAASAVNKELTVTLDTPDLDYRLVVAEVDSRPVGEVQLAVEPLVDELGRQHLLAWGLETYKPQDVAVLAKPLPPLSRLTVSFRATLPELGTYTATLTPYWGGAAHQKVLLKVVRRRLPLNLAVSESSLFAQDGDTDVATFWLNLQETEGNRLQLDHPVLASLAVKRGSESNPMPIARTAKFVVEADGKELGSQEPIALSPNGSKNVSFRLESFPGPGRYEAKLRFTASGALPLERTVTLCVRSHPLVAAFFLALGVVVSWALKWWTSKEQPRLHLQELASRFAPELEALLRSPELDAEERDLGNAVRTQLAQLLSGISQGHKDSGNEAVEAMSLRVAAVRNWIAVHRSVRQLPTASVRQEFLGKLGPIRDDLASADTEVSKLREHQSTLRSLPSQLEMAVRTHGMLEQLQVLQQEMPDPTQAQALTHDVMGCLARGDLQAAAERLAHAQDAVLAARVSARAQAGAMMGVEEVRAKRASLALVSFRGFSTPVLEEALALTVRRLQRGVVTEILVNATIAFVAVALGMKALFVDDLAWGGWTACLTAFIWGLGLHQFAYAGVGSVMDKLTKPAGSS